MLNLFLADSENLFPHILKISSDVKINHNSEDRNILPFFYPQNVLALKYSNLVPHGKNLIFRRGIKVIMKTNKPRFMETLRKVGLEIANKFRNECQSNPSCDIIILKINLILLINLFKCKNQLL